MDIFVCGPAGAGKSYVCKYLMDKYGYRLKKFAEPVYNIATGFFNMQGKDRGLLQLIGTECGRDFLDPSIWLNRFYEDFTVAKEVARRLDRPFNVCVDDCRFVDEYVLLTQMGFVGIYLTVDDNIRFNRLEGRDGSAQKETLKHKSELEMDEFKDKLYQLDSNNSLETTYQKLEELLEHIRRERNAKV